MKKILRRALAGLLGLSLLAGYALAAGELPPKSDAANERIEVTADKVTSGAQSFWADVAVSGFRASVNVSAEGLQNADFRVALMDADTYVRELGANPANMTYDQFEQPGSAGVTTVTHYLYKTGERLGADGTVKTVPLGDLKQLGLNNQNDETAGDQKANYYRSYVYFIAVQQMGTAKENYFVGTFAIDNEGKLLEQTYLVRYRQNQSANSTDAPVTGTMSASLVPQGQDAVLLANQFRRTGYTFRGWDQDADFWKTWRAGKTGDDAFTYVSQEPPAYTDGGAVPYRSETAYEIVDVYAQWYPQVPQFDGKAATLPSGDAQPLKVGVPYAQQYALLTGDKGTTSADTDKTYSVVSEDKLPAGLTVSQADKTHWKISGTPTVQTETETKVRIRVTDSVNRTFDEIEVTVPPVAKGEQAVRPDLDVTTGLQSNVRTDEADAKDGMLYGFYAKGQPDANADGTGTLTDFYLKGVGNEALIYEYRPKPTEGAETETAWREVPLPEAHYTQEQQDDGLAASMELGATVRAASTLTHGAAQAETVFSTEQPAWPDPYGFVAFESGLPVLHGLTEGAEYEVRFKANADYGASAPVSLPIVAGGGGTVSGGAGPTLRVNLAGGVLPVDDEATADTDEAAAFLAFLKACGALESGGTATLPAVLPTRTGYSFGGWRLSATDAQGAQTEQTLQPGDTVALGDEALTLAPIWNAGAGDFTTLEFYEWDESLLGTAVISKNATPADVDAAIEAFTAARYKGFVTKTDAAQDESLTATVLPADLTTDAYDADAAYPLTSKDGYHFTGWMQVTDEQPLDTFTSVHDEDRDAALAAARAMVFDPAEHPENTPWEATRLKAVYTGNTKLQITGALSNYMLTAYEGDMYGNSTAATAGNAAVKMTYERKNTNGQPVARKQEPNVQALYTIGGQGTYLQGALQNIDQASVEFVIPKTATNVRFVLYDAYGANVVNNTAASQAWNVSNKTAVASGSYDNSFIVIAATDSISKRARQQNTNIKTHKTSAEWTTGIGRYTMETEAGLKINNLQSDRYKILLAVYAFGSDILLTKAELQDAMDMTFTQVNIPTSNPNESVYLAMEELYGYIDQAIELHGGSPLNSIAQVQAALESHGTSIG